MCFSPFSVGIIKQAKQKIEINKLKYSKKSLLSHYMFTYVQPFSLIVFFIFTFYFECERFVPLAPTSTSESTCIPSFLSLFSLIAIDDATFIAIWFSFLFSRRLFLFPIQISFFPLQSTFQTFRQYSYRKWHNHHTPAHIKVNVSLDV